MTQVRLQRRRARVKVQVMATTRLILLTTLALALTAPAAAQPSGGDRKGGRPAPEAPAAPSAQPDIAPPYEPQLLRLAEILGALHHLRTVCAAPDADTWRDRMSALIEAEGPSPERRDRLAGAFNASYRTWARSYRTCTPAAEVAVLRFLTDASRLVTDVNARYGQ